MDSSKKDGIGTGGRFIPTFLVFRVVSVVDPLFCASGRLVLSAPWSDWSGGRL